MCDELRDAGIACREGPRPVIPLHRIIIDEDEEEYAYHHDDDGTWIGGEFFPAAEYTFVQAFLEMQNLRRVWRGLDDLPFFVRKDDTVYAAYFKCDRHPRKLRLELDRDGFVDDYCWLREGKCSLEDIERCIHEWAGDKMVKSAYKR